MIPGGHCGFHDESHSIKNELYFAARMQFTNLEMPGFHIDAFHLFYESLGVHSAPVNMMYKTTPYLTHK